MEERYEDYFQSYTSTLSASQLAEIDGVETTYFCDDELETKLMSGTDLYAFTVGFAFL